VVGAACRQAGRPELAHDAFGIFASVFFFAFVFGGKGFEWEALVR
jgi:hypothetical protein